MNKYIGLLSKSQDEYAKAIKVATKEALDFLKIEESCYEQSFILARANQEIYEKLHQREEEVRLQIDTERKLPQTREQILKIYLEKL